MSISLPSYTRREMPLLGRRHRILAIVTSGLRREFKRPAAIFSIVAGSLIVTLVSIVLLFVFPMLPGQSLDRSFFFAPASNPATLFFVTLMAATVGAGLIADDRGSMALTLYLSRPITQADYLMAKGAILGTLVCTITILPMVITAIAAALLGLAAWDVALAAAGLGVATGLLLGAVYTSLALFLSSLTSRRAYAAAGVFAVTFGLGIPAELLATEADLPALLYVVPWQNFLAVTRAAFDVSASPIDWIPALGILLGITFLASLVTYLRMRALEVVTG